MIAEKLPGMPYFQVGCLYSNFKSRPFQLYRVLSVLSVDSSDHAGRGGSLTT